MKKIAAILIFTGLFFGCTQEGNQLPDILVDEWVYISNPSNLNLQSPGGWIYVPGGLKGIILYRYSQTVFKAYERSCPHLSPSSCSMVEVLQDIKAKCPCDGSEFLLSTGEPLKIAPNALKEYRAYYDEFNQTVHIVN